MIAMAKQILILLKLRIGLAMVLTSGMGMAIGSGHELTVLQTILLLVAVLLSAGAAGALNHYYDHDIDAKMVRTKNRPFVTGSLPHHPIWLLFFAILLIIPVFLVAHFINFVAAFNVFLGALFYGVVYTIWLKRRTWLNIVIGGLAGSFAILAGATAVNPVISPLAAILAFVLFLWTPSHFWSLAIALKEEYRSANIPMLPVVVGEAKAAWVVFANTVLLVSVSIIPFFYGLGWIYLVGVLLGGGFFLFKSLLLAQNPSRASAMASFHASLIQLGLLLAVVFLDSGLAV